MFLIIWDKMFGTFQKELPAESYQPIKYGLTTPMEKENAFTIVFYEWINIFKDLKQKNLTFKQKLGYLFGPPGWSHNGSRQTSEQMRRQEELEQRNQ
ncbi:hypothetical protein LWM68_32165 [Niabella sp. W65]|nr:hypothetical protein [Niabella sp. W65]MCH7367014.1 hypothetical protein [Niabella sp. W65]